MLKACCGVKIPAHSFILRYPIAIKVGVENVMRIKGFYDDGRKPMPVWWTEEMCCEAPFIGRDNGGKICRNCGLVWIAMPNHIKRKYKNDTK